MLRNLGHLIKYFCSYHSEYLRFGKVDVGRYPDAGKKYHVSDSPVSRQLPTLILFQNGKETIRRPTVNSSKTLQKFFFSEVSYINNFLNLLSLKICFSYNKLVFPI